MRGHWQYFKYVARHKWFVMVECFKRGLLWRGLKHDWDKFLPSMFLPYSRHFYNPDGTKRQVRDKTGYYKPTDTGDAAFDLAWFGHTKRARHHWQWWCLAEDRSGRSKVFPMTRTDVVEMVCDWRGAARAQGVSGQTCGEWFDANADKMMLHHVTHAMVLEELERVGEPSKRFSGVDHAAVLGEN